MHADQLTPLLKLAAKKGVTDLVPGWFKYIDWNVVAEGTAACASFLDRLGRGTLTGSLSKWLAGQGIAVFQDGDIWRARRPADCWLGFCIDTLNATDHLSALIEAATARLEEMHDKEKA